MSVASFISKNPSFFASILFNGFLVFLIAGVTIFYVVYSKKLDKEQAELNAEIEELKKKVYRDASQIERNEILKEVLFVFAKVGPKIDEDEKLSLVVNMKVTIEEPSICRFVTVYA
uniref:ATP synthase protein MI25 n=1 Tax=Panagrolaimus sp. JU765 TaxID=591449 RepID=A0AC34R585_9BILA